MIPNTPNINPANNGTLVGTIQFAYEQMLKNTDGMLPGKVLTYDRETNRAQVQLLITLITTNGEQVARPTIANLPVLILGGGGFTLSFPLNVGDLGWVMANDRDISLFLQTYAQAQPNTGRIKNFSDGLFIPDVMRSYNVTENNEGYVTLQSTDGKASVSMGVNSGGGTEVNITGDRVNIELNNTTTGLATINGNLVVNGLITSPLPLLVTPIIPPFPPVYPP